MPPRRRRSPAARQIQARPDRIALWAVLLGLFLVFMAAAHGQRRSALSRTLGNATSRCRPAPFMEPLNSRRYTSGRVLLRTVVSVRSVRRLYLLTVSSQGKRSAHEDQGEQVPSPRRSDCARAQPARPQGRARRRRPALQHRRGPGRLSGRAAGLRALPLGASPRHAAAEAPSSASRWPWPSIRAASTRSPRCGAPHARPASASTRSRWRGSSTPTTSARPPCCATCRALLESDGPPPLHLHEEAREAGWEDEQILEAVAHVALNSFANLVTRAGDVPNDGSVEESRLLQARVALERLAVRPPHSRPSPQVL